VRDGTLLQLGLVAAGGAVGSAARHGVSVAMSSLAAPGSPLAAILATLAVNVTGSFVIGMFAAFAGFQARPTPPSELQAFVAAGVCGGFTTFSAFSLQTLRLVQDGAWARAGACAIASLVLCVAAAAAGNAGVAALRSARPIG